MNVRNPEHVRMIDVILLVTASRSQHWHGVYGVKQGFTKETFNAIIQTTKCIPRQVDYLLDIKELDYELLGYIQSDYLEQRFGWYRQLWAANYFNSVLQLLQAEKSIRIRSLLDMNFNMDGIEEIFHEQNARTGVGTHLLLEEIDGFEFNNSFWINRDNADEAISYYIEGYIAKCIMKSTSCASRHKIVSDGEELI